MHVIPSRKIYFSVAVKHGFQIRQNPQTKEKQNAVLRLPLGFTRLDHQWNSDIEERL